MTDQGLHVLLVNDDPFSLDTMGMILEMDGYLVSAARCRCKALEALERRGDGPRIDLMVVDLEMPDHSGIGLIGEMKSRGLSVPILVVTEFTHTQTVVDLLRQGVMDYLDKPVSMHEFRQRIAHMGRTLRRRRKGAAAAPAALPSRAQDPAPVGPPAEASFASPLPVSMRPLGAPAHSASTIDTSDSALPSSVRSHFTAQAGGTVALACRHENGCDILAAEVENETAEAFYQSILIKSCFDHHREAGYDGQSFMRFLNKSLLEGSLGRNPVHALFVRFFLGEKRMEAIAAGKPSLTLFPSARSQPLPVMATGEPLGVHPEARSEARVLPIDSGDRILICTRGFSAAARGAIAARGGFEDLVASLRDSSLDAMVEKIWNDVLAYGRARSNHAMFFWGLQVP